MNDAFIDVDLCDVDHHRLTLELHNFGVSLTMKDECDSSIASINDAFLMCDVDHRTYSWSSVTVMAV